MAKRRKKYSDIVKKHVANPKHIRGIFNYCDRWCERCPMTSRCSVFAITQEHCPDGVARDADNARFWERLSEVFQGTLEMVREDAQRQGISFDSKELATFAAKHRRRQSALKKHECPRAAKRYAKMVDAWFKSAKPLFTERKVALESQARMQLPGADPEADAARLKDVVEVVQFYQHQIWVKMMRATGGLLEEKSEPPDEYPKDSDGSAKVALIGIDRSISAWSEMRLQFPDQDDSVLDILVHLDRLRRNVEKTFPDARSFVRTGFDAEPTQRT
ncbi:MAG: hypothetical protein ABSA67_04825 [Candidatus Brocadiia bacterium]|jgi:hypothetical protein